MPECKYCGGWKSTHPGLVSVDPPECECRCWRCGATEDLWGGIGERRPSRPVCVVCAWELVSKGCDESEAR